MFTVTGTKRRQTSYKTNRRKINHTRNTITLYLYLLNSKVKKCETTSHRNQTFWTDATHACAEPTIKLYNNKLAEQLLLGTAKLCS